MESQMPREEEEEVILEFVLNLGYCEWPPPLQSSSVQLPTTSTGVYLPT